MFDTYPEAEVTLSRAFSHLDQRSWCWVELSLQIPYFFLAVTVETDEGSFGRDFLFSQLRDVMDLIAALEDVTKQVKIGLLSPGYMNGSGSYQLGQVKEIWKRLGGREQMFLMSDGARFYFPPDEDGINDQEMELVISL